MTSRTKQLDLSQKSVVLATLQLTREGDRKMPWPTRFQVVPLAPIAGQGSETFAVDSDGMDYGEDGRHYLVPLRLSLPPGKYAFTQVTGEISAFPLKGIVTAPLGLSFELPARSVVYVGRMNVHMRTRKDDGEPPAGAPFPIVNQSVLGITSSTFDVSVADESTRDLTLFRESFPVLEAMDIKVQPPRKP
ncbi:hypothetical protein [Variovorax sp. E3]|uniref:hypothetical protein n=1 Tax=Variovorax sp. E3 TaxID=1914993 RepID=UPI0018DE9B60|nr:hypothetical protein [Variovorax sp. E3]